MISKVELLLILIMNKKLILIFCLLNLNLFSEIYANDDLSFKLRFPEGISFGYGIGKFAVKDEYISREIYSGNLPSLRMKWMRAHDKYYYVLGFDFRNSDNIRNHTLPATVTQFSLYQNYLYPLGNLHLFDKNIFIYLGPSTDIYFYFNQQQFAESGIYFDFSFLAMLSAGVDVFVNMPITKKWSIESSLGLNIFSLGLQTPEVIVDKNEEAGSAIKLLTAFNGFKSGFDLSLRYYILRRLSAGISYNFEFGNVIVRKRIITINDNAIVYLNYQF